MTTNQTIDGVPGLRSLIERVTSQDLGMSAKKDRAEAAHELRALLDAPACKECEDVGYHVTMGVQRSCWACKPAAQPQGEPVARHPDAIIEGVMTSVGISHAIYASTVSLKHGEQVKLYAEQTAPVAVAGTRTPFEIEHDAEPGDEAAFRQRRQERLNPTRPAHANPPPGTEPSGTHHDNDGLDEMRKPK